MEMRTPTPTLRFTVTPRFDIFYALRALGRSGNFAAAWRDQISGRLPARFEALMRKVAGRPSIWPLLADALRDTKANPTFDEISDAIRTIDDVAFQRAVLGGVFRDSDVTDELISGRKSLRAAVENESRKSSALLSVIGLYPFDAVDTAAHVFTRIISNPTAYRTELLRVLETFWSSGFEATWDSLEPHLRQSAATMDHAQKEKSSATFASEERLPILFDDSAHVITTVRGTSNFSYAKVEAIYVMPSAFNDARFWAAYTSRSGLTTLYFPLFKPELLQSSTKLRKTGTPAGRAHIEEPALGFRALGDTTRYAIAWVLARSPRTSVELAKEFGVSKPTISHHVQMLRSAGLLNEQVTDHGVALSLDRAALESLSVAAAREMFAAGAAPSINRSRHEAGTRKKAKAAHNKSEPSMEVTE